MIEFIQTAADIITYPFVFVWSAIYNVFAGIGSGLSAIGGTILSLFS